MRKLILILTVFLLFSTNSLADTYRVINTNDTGAGLGNDGDLRYCITQANNNSGPDIIEFHITSGEQTSPTSGKKYFTIDVTGTALPTITGQVTIDATTQTVSSGTAQYPVVEITDSGAYNVDALTLSESADNSLIKGLNINSFLRSGIYIPGADNCKILGCYIGTDIDGLAAKPNGFKGIAVANNSTGNQVGDGTVSGRNVISGNDQSGIWISGGASAGNEVIGNYIGTDINGTANLGNARNGVGIDNGSDSNIVGPDNLIAFNGTLGDPYRGILVDGATTQYNKITQNSIFSNNGAGILLTNYANDNISEPAIDQIIYYSNRGSAEVRGASFSVNGTIEAFISDNGQGKTYLGSGSVSASNSYAFIVGGVSNTDAVVTTATDTLSNTSTFSAVAELPDPGDPGYIDLDHYTVGINGTIISGIPFETLLVARQSDGTDQIIVFGTTTVSLAAGTVTPETIDSSAFVAGEWTGNLTLSQAGVNTIYVSNGTATSQEAIIVYNASREYTSSDLGISGMSISIPEAAATDEVNITVTEVSAPGNSPAGYYVAGKYYNISCNVTNFLEPVTVTMPVTGTLANPKIMYWDGSQWSSDGITVVSYTATSITFTTTHFTVFAPFGTSTTNLFRFGPNPYNPNSGVDARIWYWLDNSSEITIYIIDLSGTIVWKSSYPSGATGGSAGANSIAFDGKTSWGDTLANGVYLYKIVSGGKSLGGGKLSIIK